MNELKTNKNEWTVYLLLSITAIGYYLLCYHTARYDFLKVFALFTVLFACYYFINKKGSFYYKQLLIAGFLFRILILFSTPNLSDDVYRFIWDGRLLANAINPYHQLPVEVIKSATIPGITNDLFHHLNSPGYYTIYPPVLQAIFWLSAKLSGSLWGAIVCMKTTILLAEMGTIFILPLILQRLHLPRHLSLLYSLNPLVIAELTGNVHFDAIMIFFLTIAFLLLLQNKVYVSAIFLGLSISSKLIPVVFIPLIIKRLGWKLGLMYAVISGFVTVALFALIIDKATILHFFESINLFISHFEFNASLYYIIRWLGTLVTGYNIIAFAGPLLSATAAIVICMISFWGNAISDRQFFTKALFILTVYYLFATTVHPWYICMPIMIAACTAYRYAMVWSYLVTLSYYAYHSNPVKENVWLVLLSYLAMLSFAVWELRKHNKSNRIEISH